MYLFSELNVSSEVKVYYTTRAIDNLVGTWVNLYVQVLKLSLAPFLGVQGGGRIPSPTVMVVRVTEQMKRVVVICYGGRGSCPGWVA